MILYLGIPLTSLVVTAWAATLPGGETGSPGALRGCLEILCYFLSVPVLLYWSGFEPARLGVVVLVLCGVHLAHRTLYAVIRRARSAAK